MESLDNLIDVIDSMEARDRERYSSTQNAPKTKEKSGREHIGTVEHFFSKISVVAISLTSSLNVGDIIEIGTEEDAIRQKVSEMQIDRSDVYEAHAGSSIGIKTKHVVEPGSPVYKVIF